MKFNYHHLLFATLIAFLFLSSNMQQQKKEDTRPNIVFIMSDDHAYQAISAYGDSLNSTPNLDLLAKEGMLFKRAFVNNSMCAKQSCYTYRKVQPHEWHQGKW